MRRKKDDKRVLRPGNGRNNNRKRIRTPKLRDNFNRQSSHKRNNFNKRNSYNKRKKNRSPKTVFIMILILVAFVIGAGMGVMLSFDDGSDTDNETHVENVTVEMTTGLNNTSDSVDFDELDEVDYNENASTDLLGVEDNPYYDQPDPDY